MKQGTTLTEEFPENSRLDLLKGEVLYAKHYIQLISVCRYQYRDGEILNPPVHKPKPNDQGTIIRAVFFVTTNRNPKLVNVLYRAFGKVNSKEDLDKIQIEIERNAHPMYYYRKNKSEAKAIADIPLEAKDWE